jgi:hypothetical protein
MQEAVEINKEVSRPWKCYEILTSTRLFRPIVDENGSDNLLANRHSVTKDEQIRAHSIQLVPDGVLLSRCAIALSAVESPSRLRLKALLWPRSSALARMNNESFWCGSNVVERITGDQRQLRIYGRAEHFNILRIDHFGAFHSISADSRKGCVCLRARPQIMQFRAAVRVFMDLQS